MKEVVSAKWGIAGKEQADVTAVVVELIASGKPWKADCETLGCDPIPTWFKSLDVIFADGTKSFTQQGHTYWESAAGKTIQLPDGGGEWRRIQPPRLSVGAIIIVPAPPGTNESPPVVRPRPPAAQVKPRHERVGADAARIADEFKQLAIDLDTVGQSNVAELKRALCTAQRRAAQLIFRAVNGGCLAALADHLADNKPRIDFPMNNGLYIYDSDSAERWRKIGEQLLTEPTYVRLLIGHEGSPDFGLPMVDKVYERWDASGQIVESIWEGIDRNDEEALRDEQQRVRDYSGRFREIAGKVHKQPVAEPPTGQVGEDQYIVRRYLELAVESEFKHGDALEKIGRELSLGRSTMFDRIKKLREEGKLPASAKRPKISSNRQHTSNPTRD